MLRIEIDGQWEAKDFMHFYESVHILYSAFAIVFIEQESEYEDERFYKEFLAFYPPSIATSRRMRSFLRMQPAVAGGIALIPPSKFRDADDLLEPNERLVVRRCTYASPGATDFTGIGQVLGHVKDIILRCIDVYTSRRERQIKNEILEQERDAKTLQNVAERIKLLKSLGYSDSHCRQIMAEISPAIAKLEMLVDRGLIKQAKSIENDG